MILEIQTEDGAPLAFQAVAQVRVLDRKFPRNLLGATVRELLEHYLQVEVGRRSEPQIIESLQSIRCRLSSQLERDLKRRGVELVELTLRAIQLEAAPRDPEGFWMEYVSPEMRTVEGFTLVMDAVARVVSRSYLDTRPDELRERAGLALRHAFESLPRSLDLETLNRDRGGLAQEILGLAYPCLKSTGVDVERLAITDIRVNARELQRS